METTQQQPSPSKPNNNNNEEIDDEEVEEEDEEYEYEEIDEEEQIPQSTESKLRNQRFKVQTLSRRLSSELVPIRVHDVIINGNTKTKDWIIEAELNGIENATTMQELMQASQIAIAKLQALEIFDSCKVKLEAGPIELPDTANVIVDVVETEDKLSGAFGVYMKPSVLSYSFSFFVMYSCFDSIQCEKCYTLDKKISFFREKKKLS
jgi:outer membrane protein insertion porin family